MANPYVAVVGNVCAGKTTFVNRFASLHAGWQSLPETLHVGKWKYPPGADGFTIATFFLIYYANCHLQAQKLAGPLIQETCLETNNLFPEAYHELGLISSGQSDLLKLGNGTLIDSLPRPDYYIYVYAPLEILLARADRRKEPARSLSLKLIPAMQERLNEWIDHQVDPERIFRIDTGRIDIVNEEEVFEEAVHRVKERLGGPWSSVGTKIQLESL